MTQVFEQNYQFYLDRLSGLDFEPIAGAAGGRYVREEDGGESIVLPLLDSEFKVTARGIEDAAGERPGYDTCILLSRYLIMADERLREGGEPVARNLSWTGFRELKDTGPLTVYFRDSVEGVLSTVLEEHSQDLEKTGRALSDLGGRVPDLSVHYDLALEFSGLPHVPLLLLFNRAEEGFAANCSLLFAADVSSFLDGECVAMIGHRLASRVKNCLG